MYSAYLLQAPISIHCVLKHLGKRIDLYCAFRTGHKTCERHCCGRRLKSYRPTLNTQTDFKRADVPT
jgi:hypothetical protein